MDFTGYRKIASTSPISMSMLDPSLGLAQTIAFILPEGVPGRRLGGCPLAERIHGFPFLTSKSTTLGRPPARDRRQIP